MDRKSIKYIPFITMLPAIIIGAVAMKFNNIPTSIYIQNILCFVMLGVVYFFMQKSKYKIHKIEPLVFIIISLVVLVFTFISSGLEGVHRWVSVGPIQLYASAIVVPIIIINLWSLLQEGKIMMAIISIMCVSVILTLQPDASMMTAFSVSSIILSWNKIKNFSRFLVTVFLSGLTVVTWIFLDGLEPVSYVEGIFKLVIDMGILGLILGVISLAVLIIPFLIFPPKKNKIVSICFGIYFIIILISNVFGNFPVPLMGYGISPIIGYFISIVWLTKTKIN